MAEQRTKEDFLRMFTKLEWCLEKYYEEYFYHRFYIVTDADNVNFTMPETLFAYMIGVNAGYLKREGCLYATTKDVLDRMIAYRDEYIENCLDDDFFCEQVFSPWAEEAMDDFLNMPIICLENIDHIAKPDSSCMILCVKKNEQTSYLFLMVEDKVGAYYAARSFLTDRQREEYYYASKILFPETITHHLENETIYETKNISKPKGKKKVVEAS